jgi:hypothetical protein
MQSIIFSQILIATAFILLVIATLTRNWQILGIETPQIHTNIGLWQTCSKSQTKPTVCHVTKAGSSHKFILCVIRLLSVLSVLVVVAANFRGFIPRSLSLTLLGIAVLLTGSVLILYSSQLENYFSQYFDSLMYSKYGYSYYIQVAAITLLIIALILGCSNR